MSDKLQINKIRILTTSRKQFQGEAYYQGDLIAKTVLYLNKPNCIRALNRKIEEYNLLNDTKVPLMEADGKEIIFQSKKNKVTAIITEEPAKKEAEVTSDTTETPESVSEDAGNTESTKPKRKPFTPYGLNGYLVDKQGNVRLMLDRRASASTIVLEPAMFAALAEMVQRTQLQREVGNA